MKGYVQVYTGDGKGKTTAALGLAIRAAGAGLSVYISQFMKGKKSSEHLFLSKFSDRIKIKQFGNKNFVKKVASCEDICKARRALNDLKRILSSGEFDLVILDEVNVAIFYKLFSTDELLEVLEKRPRNIEVVLTGRNAPKKLIEFADLVTEMKDVKHYFSKKVKARKGIEY